MARPELKTVQDLGMKPEKAPKAKPSPEPSLYQRVKHAAGEMTVTPASEVGEYLTDARKGMK